MSPTTLRMLTFACVFAATQALAGPSSTEPPVAPTAVPNAQATAPSQAGPSETTQNPASLNPAGPDQAGPSQAAPSTAPPAPEAPVTAEPRKITRVVLRDDTVSDSQLKQIISAGYRPEKRADGVRYCRREAQLGTRFEKKICRTATEIMDSQNYAKEVTETATRGRHWEKFAPASGGQ